MIRRVPIFYGWVILMAGMTGIVMMGPSQTFTVSLFLDSFVQDLGISRGMISLFYGMATLAASLLLPVIGRLVDRYGTRRLITAIVPAFSLALMALAWVTGPLSLLGVLLVVRFLGFGSMQLVSNNVIAQWWVRRRGVVMGLSGQSLAISLLLWPALSNWLIEGWGWRMAWVALGVVSLVVMLPVGWLFFRDRPELYGLQPDGDGVATMTSSPERHWTLDEAKRTGIFWLFATGFAIISMITAGMAFHQASLFATRGLDRDMAVLAFQLTAIFSIVGNLGVGYLLDRTSPRYLLVGQLICLLGTMLLVLRMNDLWGVVGYSALMGLVTGSFRVMDATVWANYFGRHHLGSIRGATMIGTVGGTALGAYPLGLSYDLTGSYAMALLTLLALPVAVAILSFWIKRPATRSPVMG